MTSAWPANRDDTMTYGIFGRTSAPTGLGAGTLALLAGTEHSSAEVARIASRGLKDPSLLLFGEIKSVCGSALTQTMPRGLGANYGLFSRPGAAMLMGLDEYSSERIAGVASRGLKDPTSLTPGEIRAVCGSVLTQAPNR